MTASLVRCLIYEARTIENKFTTYPSLQAPVNGSFSTQANSKSSAKVIFELGAFRIFKPAPVIFPDISGKE